MKKQLLFGLFAIVMMAFPTSCTDVENAPSVEKTYSEDALILTYNSALMTGKSVMINREDKTLTLNGIVTGEPTIILELEEITYSDFVSEGTVKITNTEITYNVSVKGEICNVDLAVTMPKAVYKDETLQLTYGDEPMYGKSAVLDRVNNTLTLNGVILEQETTVLNINEISYSDFISKGIAEQGGVEIGYSVSVKGDVCAIALTVKMPESNIMGSWSFDGGAMMLSWTTKDNLKLNFGEEGYKIGPLTLKGEKSTSDIAGLVNLASVLVVGSLDYIDFQNDGNIVVRSKASDVQTPKNIAMFTTPSESELKLYFNFDALMGSNSPEKVDMLSTRNPLAGIETIMNLIMAGIPITSSIVDSNLFLTIETTTLLPLLAAVVDLLPMITVLIPDIPAEIKVMLNDKILMKSIKDAVANTDKLELLIACPPKK